MAPSDEFSYWNLKTGPRFIHQRKLSEWCGKECPWPDDDYRCYEQDHWGSLKRQFREAWEREKTEYAKRWDPYRSPTFDPVKGQQLFFDFKPVINEWFKKNYVVAWGVPFTVRPGFGSAVLVGMMGGWFMAWNYRQVQKARKRCGVPTPLCYSKDSYEFNCYWRAYQSTCEAYPQFLYCLLMGAMEFPYFSALGGLIWLLGRFIYCLGWQSGRPRRRYWGSFYLIGSFMMTHAAIRAALYRLGEFNEVNLVDYSIFKPDFVPYSSSHWIEKYYPKFFALKPAP